jgi:hypothetical protein
MTRRRSTFFTIRQQGFYYEHKIYRWKNKFPLQFDLSDKENDRQFFDKPAILNGHFSELPQTYINLIKLKKQVIDSINHLICS